MTCYCWRDTPGQLWSKPKVFPQGKKFTLVPFYSARRLEKSLPLVLLENVVFVNASDVRQKWGLPSHKAQQDPEKEAIKRNPLHEIVYEKHILTRDKLGGRKLQTTLRNKLHYNSRPKGERAVDQKRVEELSKSNCQHFVCKFLSYHPEVCRHCC